MVYWIPRRRFVKRYTATATTLAHLIKVACTHRVRSLVRIPPSSSSSLPRRLISHDETTTDVNATARASSLRDPLRRLFLLCNLRIYSRVSRHFYILRTDAFREYLGSVARITRRGGNFSRVTNILIGEILIRHKTREID